MKQMYVQKSSRLNFSILHIIMMKKAKIGIAEEVLMSTLEYTVSMLEAMPEERLKEVQSYIQYIMFRDRGTQ